MYVNVLFVDFKNVKMSKSKFKEMFFFSFSCMYGEFHTFVAF